MAALSSYSILIYCFNLLFLIFDFILFSHLFFAKCHLIAASHLFFNIAAYIDREACLRLMSWSNSFPIYFMILLIVFRCFICSLCFYLKSSFLSFQFLNFHNGCLLLLQLTQLLLQCNHLFDCMIVNLKKSFFCLNYIFWI